MEGEERKEVVKVTIVRTAPVNGVTPPLPLAEPHRDTARLVSASPPPDLPRIGSVRSSLDFAAAEPPPGLRAGRT